MEKNEIWLRNKNGGSYKNERYKLFSYCRERLWCADGNIEPLIGIVRYYKNNEGEWERCDYAFYYVTLSTLLTDFIAIDNAFDQELNKLTEKLADIWRGNLENTFKINGTLGDPIKPEDIGVEVIPPQEEEANINDGE